MNFLSYDREHGQNSQQYLDMSSQNRLNHHLIEASTQNNIMWDNTAGPQVGSGSRAKQQQHRITTPPQSDSASTVRTLEYQRQLINGLNHNLGKDVMLSDSNILTDLKQCLADPNFPSFVLQGNRPIAISFKCFYKTNKQRTF